MPDFRRARDIKTKQRSSETARSPVNGASKNDDVPALPAVNGGPKPLRGKPRERGWKPA